MSARSEPTPVSRGPLAWCWALTAAFFALVVWRIATPSITYFDEIHYLPAARELLELGTARNKEHPMVGKELIALSLRVFGDNAFGWRIGSAVCAGVALFAAMRATWWASLSPAATLLAGVLLASNFLTFLVGRIAMLDPYMLAFAMIGVWLCAHAVRVPAHGRRSLALAGIAFGLSLGAKWSVLPVAMLPGLAFLAVRWHALAGRRRAIATARDAAPVPGVSLAEAALWLGLVPVAVYLLTFLPLSWFAHNGEPFGQVIAFQKKMLDLQESVIKPHPYMSNWWQWVANWRPMWWLYEQVDGAQRGVLMVGNPFTMIAGLPALVICAIRGWGRRDAAMLAAFALYAASLGIWIVAPKPVQFYYHYLLPATFLTIALALVLAAWWDRGRRWPAWLATGVSVGIFAWFYPILSAAPLPDAQAFLTYTWLHSWR